ncbi:MAG: ABC transporter ATP-binding protein [Deltaproteobacteria bacterium]|nr:ABC transporter ATP-binding protein [Deltaproteobacteria bacterium]
MKNQVINFDQVWKTYPRQIGTAPHTALKDVSFALRQGQTLGLIGANGAGKTTCIRLLMDFIRPDKGIISLLGSSPGRRLIRRKVGYLPETPSFPSNLTILDMLRFTGTTCHLSKGVLKQVSEKWLNLLGLWEVRKRPLRTFSKGMQQRANFAIALINDPELLILDEPMSGLDPIGRAEIINLIQDLKKQGKSILFCSHILEDVDMLVDKVLILHGGKNFFFGRLNELCEQEKSSSLVDAYLSIIQREGTDA